MTDDEKLMHQSLRAMLNNPDDISDEMLQAIRDLKERLAQPEQKPEPPQWWPAVENILDQYGLQAIDFVADFKEAMKQAEQEPVGVVALDASRPFVSASYGRQVTPWTQAPEVKTVMMFKDLPLSTPLYTSPPQRKPLTDEELRNLANKHLFYQPEGYEVSGVFTLARAIEAAHGIKGEE